MIIWPMQPGGLLIHVYVMEPQRIRIIHSVMCAPSPRLSCLICMQIPGQQHLLRTQYKIYMFFCMSHYGVLYGRGVVSGIFLGRRVV